jgi:hypothetical protein
VLHRNRWVGVEQDVQVMRIRLGKRARELKDAAS